MCLLFVLFIFAAALCICLMQSFILNRQNNKNNHSDYANAQNNTSILGQGVYLINV